MKNSDLKKIKKKYKIKKPVIRKGLEQVMFDENYDNNEESRDISDGSDYAYEETIKYNINKLKQHDEIKKQKAKPNELFQKITHQFKKKKVVLADQDAESIDKAYDQKKVIDEVKSNLQAVKNNNVHFSVEAKKTIRSETKTH